MVENREVDDFVDELDDDNTINTDSTQTTYPKVNIISDKLFPNFSATYKARESRAKAIAHIKALLEDATSIEIVDKYLSSVNNRTGYDVWNMKNIGILQTILPQKVIALTICCDSDWNSKREQDLSSFCTNWNVVKKPWDTFIHDRYIIKDKVKILLSSGFSNLDDNLSKNFSYMVVVK